jgi:hypothetical protein
MWPALVGVVVGYGLVAVHIVVVVSTSPGLSSDGVDGGGPVTTGFGLSWLVCALGIV